MIGANIKAARLAAGLTQKGLAAKCEGVTYQMLQRWENDTYKPNLDNLCKIATALNKTVDELMKAGD